MTSALMRHRKNGNTLFDIMPFYDTIFDDIFNVKNFSFPASLERGGPEVKVKELDNAIEVVIAVPGVRKDDINVSVDENRLTISSTAKTEFSYSEFTRSWTLPSNVDETGIKASCEDGILTVNIPKIQSEKISIPIE